MSFEKEVVTILPFVGNQVLMQLRDFNSSIPFPGCWGFFSGSIMADESPEEAAKRELFEELEYHTDILYEISQEKIADLENYFSYAYGCPLTVPTEKLVLKEGLDFALVTPEQVLSGAIYSKVLKKECPVIRISYILDTISKLFTLKEKK